MLFNSIPHYIKIIRTVFFAVLVSLFNFCQKNTADKPSGAVSRIVSCAPSVTETLFALGLGDKVVGVTNYCNYPAEVAKIEKVGGYTDINLEKVLSLRPDVVVLQQEHQKQRDFINQYGIKTISVDNKNCAGICSSFVLIGNACGAKDASDSLVNVFTKKLEKKQRGKSIPRVLVCVGRDAPGGGVVKGAFVVGRATFYNEIIEAAGGVNAYTDSLPHYPRVSQEGIIALAPDIIIDLASSMSSYSYEDLIKDWNSIPLIPAVKNKNVFCIAKDYSTVPGPRILLLLQDFIDVLDKADL